MARRCQAHSQLWEGGVLSSATRNLTVLTELLVLRRKCRVCDTGEGVPRSCACLLCHFSRV